MAGQLKLRRGTTSQLANFVGSEGELTYDTQKKQLRVHDGITVGGVKIPYLSNDLVPSAMLPTATELVVGASKIATTAIAQAGTNDTNIITAKKLRDALNATGEAPISACRAYVCFNAKTTPPTILSSFNVSSVTKAYTGIYEVFYTHAMPSGNYPFGLSLGNIANSVANPNVASIRSIGTPTSESIRLVSGNHFSNSPPAYFDPDFVSVVIF